ncbi:MAG: cation-translocating P-type ATPase [Gemmatimonadaceae bacterium]|nr:cation-translocating P-type ATPase [Gemmatimonadaceae bacterium]
MIEHVDIPHWHQQTSADVLAQLHASASGLPSDDAAARLVADGPNVLVEAPRVSVWRIFLGQFKSLLVWILVAAGLVSGALGDAIDAIAIFAIVLLNAVIGVWQEFSAEQSIAALKKMTAPMAKVRRDGRIANIPAADIVAGDILALAAGDLIAADARLLAAASFTCIESALTGESDSVRKAPDRLVADDAALGDRTNMVFMGTAVATGTAQAVVVSTGMRTELGRIAGLLGEAGASKGTPLQVSLDAFGRVLLWAALAIVGLLFVLGLVRGTAPLELFLTSVSLAVAAVPEGLPAVVTVALSLGVLRMARRRALVRKLAAVETLGSTNVICTDKTGTLTLGEMTVRALYVSGHAYDVTGEGYAPVGEVRVRGTAEGTEMPHPAPLLELATVMLGCNNAHLVESEGVWHTIGDPTEGALLVAGTKLGGDRAQIERDLPKQHEIPFDSDRKRSSVVRRMADGSLRAYVHGAPGPLLDRCTQLYTASGVRPLTGHDRKHLLAQTSDMARQALRVLGSAQRDMGHALPADVSADAIESELVFVGLSGMHDPPRPAVRSAIATCHAAGIRVVMITGDHPETATAVAREIGIVTADGEVVSGADLDEMSEEVLRDRVGRVAVYARVSAEHKLRIIRAWTSNDAVVAMTGDGVNDAPAIRGADIGIAMGRSGTEVTKQAADIIITDDNFATIVTAVEEGRNIYDNIRKTLQYLLAGNTGELLLMALCVVIGLPAPLLPIHLLWINLVTDGLPALALATDPVDPDVMTRQPRHRGARIADPRFLRTMLFTGCLTAAVAFTVYAIVLRTQPPAVARTWAFTVLVFEELVRSFGARSETRAVWRTSLFTNPRLVFVVAVSLGLQLLTQHNATLGRFLKTTPLSFGDGALLFAVGVIPLCVLEVVKAVRRRG